MEAQLLLVPRLPVLEWMFKGKVPSTHPAPDITWSKWIALITQCTHIRSWNRPGILEIITNWPEGEDFGLADDEEPKQVSRAEEAPPYNQLPADKTHYYSFSQRFLPHCGNEPEVESSRKEPHTTGCTSYRKRR
ncbi:hypothetical protein TURU_002532 [Turdus rufiventris]|nr:hypothetical protein TURU_002532 [Turdus rufiventris]